MHAPRPEPRDAQQHVDAVLIEVAAVAGVLRVGVDGVGDGVVAVNLLEGDFPLVVALDARERHHRIERARQPLLTRVVVRAVDLQPAVFEQVLRDFLARDGGVHGQAVGLRVPIGRAAVLFAGEALGSDVQAGVLAVIGGEELENVEADTLLTGDVAVDAHVIQLFLRCHAVVVHIEAVFPAGIWDIRGQNGVDIRETLKLLPDNIHALVIADKAGVHAVFWVQKIDGDNKRLLLANKRHNFLVL